MMATGYSGETWNTKEFFERAGAADTLRRLQDGDDVNARDERGWTPLHRAAAFGRTPGVVTALVEAGAAPNARDRKGRTPLHVAACFGKAVPAVAEALLAAGADPAAKDEGDKTP